MVGDTVLHLVSATSFEAIGYILQLLNSEQKMHLLQTENGKGKTALDVAVSHHQHSVIQLWKQSTLCVGEELVTGRGKCGWIM